MINLINYLNKISKTFNCKTILTDCFAYDGNHNIIYIGHPASACHVDLLLFARDHGLNKEVSAFTFCFFHELGHHETINKVTKVEDKEGISKEEYFNLQEEFLATEWAIDYCNKHMGIVLNIQKMAAALSVSSDDI